MFAGGLAVGGLWLALLGNLSTIEQPVQSTLRRTGGMVAILGVLCELTAGYMVHANQPATVKQGLDTSLVYTGSATVWALGSVLMLLMGLILAFRKAPSVALTVVTVVCAFLGIAGAVVYRDGIRDVTLLGHQFNVWDRTEVSNWGVIILFLVVFVAGLGAIGWLISVAAKAKRNSETVQS